MEFNKKQPSFLYLDKNGFYFYIAGLPNIISLAFLPTSVRDMDIINSAQLAAQIKTFVEQYQIPPSTISIILSPNITFEKDIVGVTLEEQEEIAKKFIDTIPFDSVLTKKYPIEKGIKVLGINEDLANEIKSGFEKCLFIVDSVVPYQVMGADQAFIQNMTPDNIIQLLRKSVHLKQLSMLVTEKERVTITTIPKPQTQSPQKPKNSNTRLFVMAGIFALLIGFLVFLLIKNKII
jgi:hypothetical protein